MSAYLDNVRETARPPAWPWQMLVTLQDTNAMRNVYFAHFISWQGRCREAFLAAHAPEVLAELESDLRLVTLSVSCDFYDELRAFDPITIEMRLERVSNNQLTLGFDYLLERDGGRRLAARGKQEVACMRDAGGGGLLATSLPPSFEAALHAFGHGAG